MQANSQNIKNLKVLPAFTGDTVHNKAKQHEYPFINLIRFLSMMGIVWAHTELVHPTFTATEYIYKVGHLELFIPFKQVFKFAVLCFFVISGFLLGDKLDQVNILSYYKRRINSTLKPYLVAFSLYICMVLFRTYVLNRSGSQPFSTVLYFTFFDTLFWYLPNYLLCLFILLLFKKYLKSVYFGITLLLINVGYTYFVVYVGQISHAHPTAILSYLFYLWLGLSISQQGWINKIKALNLYFISALLISTYIISCFESYYLYLHHKDYFNILRFGNQLYSLCMFVFLIRICNTNPKFGIFRPREETFGIYLYHGFFVYFIIPKALSWSYLNLNINWYHYNIYIYLFTLLLLFVICYLLTVFLVKAMLRFNFGYLKSTKSQKLRVYKS